MHIHLPKPLHGWREFGGEVGTIVLGIVVALALEQGIERLRWRAETMRASYALRDEMGTNYELAAEQVVVGPCLDRQLKALETYVLRRRRVPKPIISHEVSTTGFTVRAPSRIWMTDVWRSIVSEGVSSHLNRNFRLSLAPYYSQIDDMQDYRRQAEVVGWRLRSLAVSADVDPAAQTRYVEEIEEQRGRFERMTLEAGQILALTRKLGMAVSHRELRRRLNQSGTLKFCRTHDL